MTTAERQTRSGLAGAPSDRKLSLKFEDIINVFEDEANRNHVIASRALN